jgi:hypothetical protein
LLPVLTQAVFINPDENGEAHQGFAVRNSTTVQGAVQLVSSLCPGMCLGFSEPAHKAGDSPSVLECAHAGAAWIMKA